MFLKVQKKKGKDGAEYFYASVVENKRVKGRMVQTILINIGRVEEDQIPYLKAAWSDNKPRLVWDDDHGVSR